ncbi:MAG: TolC family protein [Bryobacteraceae bacterium]
MRLVPALFAATLWLASQAAGQTPAKPLTLADCIRLANSVPSPLTVARQEARIAALGITAARSNFLPHAGFTGGVIYNTPRPGGQAFVALNGAREYLTQAGMAMEVDTSGRLRAAYGRAKVDQDIAQSGAQLSERDLRRAVTIAYYRVLVARRIAEASQLNLVEAQKFESKVKALLSGGEAAQADLVKASAQVAAFDQSKRAADLDAKLANQELASYWTADVDPELNIEDVLSQLVSEAPSAETAGAFLRRVEFRLFDLQKRGFQLDAKRERAMLLPQISLGLSYGLDANRYEWRERGTAVVATLNVPIFDWYRAKSLAGQFTTRSQQVESTRQLTERAFSKEYEAAKSRTTSTREQLRSADQQVTLFEENLKLSRVRYEGGEGPALDVVIAQTQLQQARANYYNTLFSLAAARADLEVAAGR